jgi:hypothetical protein
MVVETTAKVNLIEKTADATEANVMITGGNVMTMVTTGAVAMKGAQGPITIFTGVTACQRSIVIDSTGWKIGGVTG